jgi:hypothetical protein
MNITARRGLIQKFVRQTGNPLEKAMMIPFLPLPLSERM